MCMYICVQSETDPVSLGINKIKHSSIALRNKVAVDRALYQSIHCVSRG